MLGKGNTKGGLCWGRETRREVCVREGKHQERFVLGIGSSLTTVWMIGLIIDSRVASWLLKLPFCLGPTQC